MMKGYDDKGYWIGEIVSEQWVKQSGWKHLETKIRREDGKIVTYTGSLTKDDDKVSVTLP
jgi:hypothetical protein